MSGSKQLRRSFHNRVVGGVCAGIANYLGIDVTIIRLIFVLAVIFWGSGVGIYIILWIAIPKEFVDYQSAINQSTDSVDDTTSYPNQEKTKNNGQLTTGAIFIIIGLLLLITVFMPRFNIFDFWPIILIVIGIVILASSFKSK